jgi:TonB-dependent SusC/RagA subfamily outer membrane receptor
MLNAKTSIMKPLLLFICFSFCLSHLLAQSKLGTPSEGSYRTIFDLLRGVPGLEVSNGFGAKSNTVTIRGTGSLNNQKQPLFVVDNAIYNGDIVNINPQDVESVSVLKDAGSTAVYGSQGSAGVIVIVTKKGDFGKSPSVNNYNKSAYSYFIEHKTELKVIGLDDSILWEGPIEAEVDSQLVVIKRRKELKIPIKNIKKVEMLPTSN